MNDFPCCPMCPNGEGVYLGRLGVADAFRCRQCGWDWSEVAYPEALSEEEEEEEDDDHEPDIDEAQEWHDFDPDC